MSAEMDGAIELAIKRFDFESVRAYMKLVNWTYMDGVPDVERLQRLARQLLRDVCAGGPGASSTSGGFVAERRMDTLHLFFSIKRSDATIGEKE